MKKVFSSDKIYISLSLIPGAGRGVFAKRLIKKRELIEACPIIVINEKQVPLLTKTELRNYYFMWGESQKDVAICLGFGSMYNHSYTPNATYKKLYHKKSIRFVALKDIKRGEEITTNYNHGNPNDTTPLWIKSIKPPSSNA